MTSKEKQQIDADAEREALALNKQGRKQNLKHIRHQTKSYSKIKFDKLFIIDKLHREN